MKFNILYNLLTEVIVSQKNINMFISKYGEIPNEKIVNIINRFNAIYSKLPTNLRDIYSYNNLSELENTIKQYTENIAPKKERIEQIYQMASNDPDVEVTFKNDRFLILCVYNEEGAIRYGKGTKWCVSAEDDNRFWEYIEDQIYFVFDSAKPSSDPMYKIAIRIPERGKKIYAWNAVNDEIRLPKEVKEIF